MSMVRVEVNVSGGGETAGEPWIWKLCRDFPVKVNVRRASIERDFGWALLELEGAEEEIQRATAWLMTTGLHVEAMTRALGA